MTPQAFSHPSPRLQRRHESQVWGSRQHPSSILGPLAGLPPSRLVPPHRWSLLKVKKSVWRSRVGDTGLGSPPACFLK